MEVPVMLVTDIDCYVKYLQSEAGFFISLQPSRQEAVVNNNLMHYDMHANPYCIYIKTEQARWERCIQHHESVFAKQKKEPCFCMCPAGVWEYAYPVYHGEEKMAVIYVSGYCADAPKGDAALRSYCRDTAMDYKSTKAVYTQYITQNIPDIKKINTLIRPLLHMLELAYAACPDAPPHDTLYAEVLYYLNENHTEPITVADISRHFHYSRSTISHIFKKNRGKSIRAYICDLRISEAKNLLENTALDVTSIAHALGFSDANYFSATFKKKCGISPLQYRKQCRRH